MTIPSVYINLEDDVSKVVDRLRRVASSRIVLVCPKRCFLFNDSINLRLLKKQTDLLGKEIQILTMDERGQLYAKEAGFGLKVMSQVSRSGSFSDIQHKPQSPQVVAPAPVITKPKPAVVTAKSKQEIQQKAVIPAPPIQPALAVTSTESYFPPEIEQTHEIKKKHVFGKKLAAGLVGISLIILLAVVFVILPRADIVVYAKQQAIDLYVQISLNAGAQTTDTANAILPATKINQSLSVTDNFSSQGKKEVGNKAAGEVQIYNFTHSPINLKAATTVLTAGDKQYVLTQDVVGLRPTTYSNNQTKEVDQSTLGAPVAVQAMQGGETYNLPAGTRLEISNQVFGSKPQFLYGKITTAIDGGTSRYLSVVSDQDMASSQAALTQELIQKLRGTLTTQGLLLPDGFYTVQVSKFASDKIVGTESPNFQATLDATVTGLGFNGSQLQNLVTDRVSKTLPPDGTLQVHNFSPAAATSTSLDLAAGTAVMQVHFQGSDIFKVNLGNITPQLEGKQQNQAMEILMSQNNVNKVTIALVPSWQKTLPWFAKKITISVAQ